MDFYRKLSEIQARMKAPKNLYNSFGKYKYRNLEGILEAFKPFEKEYGVMLLISDDIIEVGGRVYVKATASLMDTETEGRATVTAWAREPESKKGMDEPQVTGTASSYARKYALNGLFLLDDTKDPDTDEYHRQTTETKEEKTKEPDRMSMDIVRWQAKHNTIVAACEKRNIKPDSLLKGGLTLKDLTEDQLDELTAALRSKGWLK